MIAKRLGGLFIFSSFLGLFGCGPDQAQVVSNFSYDIVDNYLDLKIEFNKATSINTEFSVPILDYGKVSFSPENDNSGFTLGFAVNLKYIEDQDILRLEKTRKLPNGEPMPSYVQADVARLHFTTPSDKVSDSVYLGLDARAMYLGNAVELNVFDANFPSGLVISQRILDKQQRSLGVVTFFGPKVVNGQVVAPGGIFLMTNITDLVTYYPPKTPAPTEPMSLSSTSFDTPDSSFHGMLMPDNQPYINEPYRETLSNGYKQYQLFKQYQRYLKKAGL